MGLRKAIRGTQVPAISCLHTAAPCRTNEAAEQTMRASCLPVQEEITAADWKFAVPGEAGRHAHITHLKRAYIRPRCTVRTARLGD